MSGAEQCPALCWCVADPLSFFKYVASKKFVKVVMQIGIIHLYSTSVCVSVGAHVTMTFTYACMDSILCGPARYTYLYDWLSTNFESCTPGLAS